MIAVKPLYIPLRTRWFRAFESGDKRVEYRAYGTRWNETSCRVGRTAILSHGYSGARLSRVVERFDIVPRYAAPAEAQEIFPDALFIAAITLAEVKP